MKGNYPKAYLRMDPNLDKHPEREWMLVMICEANRMPRRGRFDSLTQVERILGRTRAKRFLEPRRPGKNPDVVHQADGSYYLEGWDEWQEGDLTVGERVKRLRTKRNTPVTPPLPDRFSPSEALGVGRQALDEGTYERTRPPTEEPPPTNATPSEARAVALEALGPPVVSDDVRAETSIREAKWKSERKLLALVARIADRTGKNADEVMKQVTSYKRKADDQLVTGRVNPALLSEERLEKSLEDAEGWLVDLDKAAVVQ